MRRRFFVDGFTGSSAALTGDAAHHLARVLRAEPGQLYELSDGESLWLAETETVGRDEIRFSLVERLPVRPTPLRIALLLAIVKFDRMEWAMEKATELGVDEIVPLAADRSEHGLIAAAPKRAERWKKILAESAQQARRLRIPHLAEAAKPRAAFTAAHAQVRLLLSERSGATPMRDLLEPAAIPSSALSSSGSAASPPAPARVAVAIGPEGGWTDSEFSAAAASGFSEAALGANIMRTETAVCAALAAVQYAFGAFRPTGGLENTAKRSAEGNHVSDQARKTSGATPASVKPQAEPTPAAWNANLYDAKHDFVWKYGSDVVSLLAPQPGERILDLGCGTGHLSAQIGESGARVVGVDRSPEMIEAARQAYPKLKFEVADARELKFEREFNAVFSNAVLHWIREPVRVIQGVRRALVPGGRFVAEFGGKGNVARIKQALENSLRQLRPSAAGEVNPWYYPSVAEYAALLEENGFEVRFMTLFDRPTGLADGEAGLRNWIAMFCTAYLDGLDDAQRESFLRKVEDTLRPDLFRDAQWWADYRRLRLVAFV